MTEKKKTKEIFSIPNILCYFRFILIPVFCVLYLSAETKTDYYIAAGVLVAASLTDFFDGLIARTFNMITELGKIIDPIADKLMHAAVALCLCKRYPLMWIVVVIMAFKEGYMGIMGIRNLKSGNQVRGALWFGKVCTAILFITLIALVIFPELSLTLVYTLIVINIVFMLFAQTMYMITFQKANS